MNVPTIADWKAIGVEMIYCDLREMNYVGSVWRRPSHAGERPTAVAFFGSSDYSGSLIDTANRAVLRRDYPEAFENDHLQVITGSHGYVAVALSLDSPEELQREIFKLAEYVAERYPILDEMLQSEMEQDMITEALNDYLLWDMRREVPEGLDIDSDDMRRAFDSAMRIWEGDYPYVEGISDVIIPKGLWEMMREIITATALV